jgi:tetratricopeptide (TPR) repeat protein
VTVPPAASLAAMKLSRARRALNELAEAHLVTEHAPGRFGLHDLLRAYAAERAAGVSPAARRSALARVLDHYLHTAYAAAVLLSPTLEPVTLAPPQPGVTPEPLATEQEALAWFEAEHYVLISAAALAGRDGFDTCAWQLPWAMAQFLDWQGHWHEWADTGRTALAAATRLGDRAGQALAARALSSACARLGDYEQANTHMTDCLRYYRQLGDRIGQGRVLQNLSWLFGQQGRYADALEHAEQSVTLFRAAGHRPGRASALNNAGWFQVLLGRPEQGRDLCRQALAGYTELADEHGQASAWDSLGYAEHHLGNLAAAADCYRHALHGYRKLGIRYLEADTLVHLGDTRRAAGQPVAARGAWERALRILEELRHRDAEQVRARLLEFQGLGQVV